MNTSGAIESSFLIQKKINLSVCIASSLVMFLSSNLILTWISIGMFGAGLSSTYPTAFTFAQKFVKISGKFASRFAIGGAIGWMTIPSIAGFFFEKYCKSMPLIVLISFILNVLILIIMNIQGQKILELKNDKNSKIEEKTKLNNREEG